MSTISEQRDNKRFPWYFVMFFAGIALIDGVLVTLAVRTNTGLVTEHPYEQGLAYNQVVKAETSQEALGWSAEMRADVTAPNTAEVTALLKDSSGNAIRLERVYAVFTRPTQSGMDFTAELTRAPEQMWRANVTFPKPGLWEMRLYAKNSEHVFQQAERIVVQ